jgi:soluble lytic murein transglycosylase-like protein
MKDLSGTYVHRGDRERRNRRIRGALMLAGVLAAGSLAARNWEPATADAEPLQRSLVERAEIQRLQEQVENARGELRVATASLERWNRVFQYSRRYKIPADLAAAVYDAARDEHIDPDLAFPLVRLESEFNEHAISSAGALGLTQLMLPTARAYQAELSRETLFDRDVNLHIGFRYLRDLIRQQRGDISMALIAYNRGPAALEIARELDLDPSNGYDRIVLRGYRGRGVID